MGTPSNEFLSIPRPLHSQGCGGVDNTIVTKKRVHGVLMAISWGFLFPVGVTIARFMKHLDPLWFKLHRGIQILGFALTIIAFIIILETGSHTEHAHMGIGITVVILTTIQVIVAIFRPHKDAPRRWLFNLFHWWNGRGLLVLALINCFIGLGILRTSDGYKAALGTIWGTIALVYLVSSYLRGRGESLDRASYLAPLLLNSNFVLLLSLFLHHSFWSSSAGWGAAQRLMLRSPRLSRRSATPFTTAAETFTQTLRLTTGKQTSRGHKRLCGLKWACAEGDLAARVMVFPMFRVHLSMFP